MNFSLNVIKTYVNKLHGSSLAAILPLAFFLCIPAGVVQHRQVPTLHLITCIDDINEDISVGCKKDYQKAVAILGAVAKDAGMNFDARPVHFDAQSLMQELENFHCGSEDVVIFLFSGHGFKYEFDDEEWRWPILFFCEKAAFHAEGSENCEVDLDDVQGYLQHSGARMSITLGDCCNNVPDSPASEAARTQENYPVFQPNEALKGLELFTHFQGHIIASAASPGETGMSTDEDGSNFSNAFFKNLYQVLQPNAAAVTWQELMENTREEVMKENPGQTPQYWIEK